MPMKDSLVKILLGIIIIILVVQSINSCSRDSRDNTNYEKQNKKLDSISLDLNRQASKRIDTLRIQNNKLTIIEKQKETEQNEVLNLTNSDSILKRYYSYRPVKIDTTH